MNILVMQSISRTCEAIIHYKKLEKNPEVPEINVPTFKKSVRLNSANLLKILPIYSEISTTQFMNFENVDTL
jgi:hypothetical protein